MNLKNQATVMMPTDLMYKAEREWGMSKAAWMDVAWDLMQEMSASDSFEQKFDEIIERRLKARAELVLMYRKRSKDAA